MNRWFVDCKRHSSPLRGLLELDEDDEVDEEEDEELEDNGNDGVMTEYGEESGCC